MRTFILGKQYLKSVKEVTLLYKCMKTAVISPLGGFHKCLLIRRGGVILHLRCEAIGVRERVSQSICLIITDLYRMTQRDSFQEPLLLSVLKDTLRNC